MAWLLDGYIVDDHIGDVVEYPERAKRGDGTIIHAYKSDRAIINDIVTKHNCNTQDNALWRVMYHRRHIVKNDILSSIEAVDIAPIIPHVKIVALHGDIVPNIKQIDSSPTKKKRTPPTLIPLTEYVCARLYNFRQNPDEKLSDTVSWLLANKTVSLDTIYDINNPKMTERIAVKPDDFVKLNILMNQYKLSSINETLWRMMYLGNSKGKRHVKNPKSQS